MEQRRETPKFFSEFALLMGRAKNSTVFLGRLCAANTPRNTEKRNPDVSYLRGASMNSRYGLLLDFESPGHGTKASNRDRIQIASQKSLG